ncbi:MAG: class I SAM-dependent methyltransferase, partial [Chloroflexi bacterium]|nr:class I SAM-dependent methyltransferase [Chloroflexota bacterium]
MLYRRDRLKIEGEPMTSGPTTSGRHLQGDATSLPADDASFDVVLFSFVFHHMPAKVHAAALAEAARVARRQVVVMEDTFRSPVERTYMHVVDSVLNAEFRGHPHSNRSVQAWSEALEAAGLTSEILWERWERWLWLVPIRHALLIG